jgi:hypothetical protein
MKENYLQQELNMFEDEAHKQMFVKGLEFIRPLTQGVKSVNEAMLQRSLKIDFVSAKWLLQQLQQADIDR